MKMASSSACASFITATFNGNRQKKSGAFIKKILKNKATVTAETIARKAERGEDISPFFTNKGKMMSPIQRVNVDFTVEMLSELDEMALKMNISRQAFIKTSLRQVLDQHHLAQRSRKAS